MESATAPVFHLLVLHCELHYRYVPSSSSFDAPKCLFWHWRYLSEKMAVYLILLRYRNAIMVSFQWRRDWFFCGFRDAVDYIAVIASYVPLFSPKPISTWIFDLFARVFLLNYIILTRCSYKHLFKIPFIKRM